MDIFAMRIKAPIVFLILKKLIFVPASHQTGLDTRSMTRRSIIEGIRGGESRAQAEARSPLDYAGHRPT